MNYDVIYHDLSNLKTFPWSFHHKNLLKKILLHLFPFDFMEWNKSLTEVLGTSEAVLFLGSDSFWLLRFFNLSCRLKYPFDSLISFRKSLDFQKNQPHFFKNSKNTFLIKPLTEIKKQQGMYSSGLKLLMIGRSFPIPKREAQRGYSALNSIKNYRYSRIYYESIILFSPNWSRRDDENLERAMRRALTGDSEKDFIDNKALTRWKWTRLRSFCDN